MNGKRVDHVMEVRSASTIEKSLASLRQGGLVFIIWISNILEEARACNRLCCLELRLEREGFHETCHLH